MFELTGQLLAAGDRFQLSELVDLCSTRLMAALSIENLAEILTLADRCRAQALTNHCLEYLRTDSPRIWELMDTEGFERLNPALVKSLLGALAPPPKTASAKKGSSAAGSNRNSSGSSSGNSLIGKKRPRDDEADAADAEAPPELAKEVIKRLKVSELKHELRLRGHNTSGLKAELVERLTNAVHGHQLHPDPPEQPQQQQQQQQQAQQQAQLDDELLARQIAMQEYAMMEDAGAAGATAVAAAATAAANERVAIVVDD